MGLVKRLNKVRDHAKIVVGFNETSDASSYSSQWVVRNCGPQLSNTEINTQYALYSGLMLANGCCEVCDRLGSCFALIRL